MVGRVDLAATEAASLKSALAAGGFPGFGGVRACVMGARTRSYGSSQYAY